MRKVGLEVMLCEISMNGKIAHQYQYLVDQAFREGLIEYIPILTAIGEERIKAERKARRDDREDLEI